MRARVLLKSRCAERETGLTALLKATNGSLMRPPFLGLLAWTTVLLWTPLMYMGIELFTANLLLLQATGVFLVALLIWLGSNKDTHCRMFMWFHRNLKLTPDRRTAGYKRQFSRIVALEVIMLNWFFYVLILVLFDPRILGPEHLATRATVGIVFFWSMWLLFFRMVSMPQPAGAIRYAVPCANIFWFCVESGSAWQLYREPWIMPFDFPVTNTLIGLAFVAGLVWFHTRHNPSAAARTAPAT